MLLCWSWYKIQYSAPKYVFQVCSAVAQLICQYEHTEKHIERWIIGPCPQWMSGRCQKLKEHGQTFNVSMSLYLPQIVTSRIYGVIVLDRYSTPLSPLSHSLLMVWCVYKHQDWYPLRCETYSAYLLVFIECCEVLRLWIMFASLQQCVTPLKEPFGLWVAQTGIQNVFGQLVCVEAGSRQCRTISKLLCDHWFWLREVCRKTDYLIFRCMFLFLTILKSENVMFTFKTCKEDMV